MRRIFLLILIVLPIISAMCFADVVKVRFIKLSTTGNRAWHDDNFGNIDCTIAGSTCIVIVTSSDGNGGTTDDILPPPILLVNVQLPPINATNVVTSQVSSLSTANFQFMTGEYNLVIEDYPNRPWYNGVSVSLDGVTSDDNGYIHVAFPWITQ